MPKYAVVCVSNHGLVWEGEQRTDAEARYFSHVEGECGPDEETVLVELDDAGRAVHAAVPFAIRDGDMEWDDLTKQYREELDEMFGTE